MSGKSYVVLASRLDQRLDDGRRVKHRQGDVVSGLRPEDVERHLAAGNIVEKSSDEAKAAQTAADLVVDDGTGTGTAAQTSADEPEPGDAAQVHHALAGSNTGAVEKPKQAHSTQVWRDYAVASGQLSRDEADATSKKDLIKTLD